MNLNINLNRVVTYITLKHAMESSRLIRLGALFFAGLCALMFLLSGVKDDSLPEDLGGVYGFGILIVAVIVIGRHTFNEFKNPLTSMGWLTLPASTEEKWLANFIVSFFMAPIIYIIAVTLGSVVVKIIHVSLGWYTGFEIFNPLSASGFDLLTSYWTIHPIFFFGAIYFNKSSVMKMSAMMAIVIVGLLIYTAWVGWLLIPDQFSNGFSMQNGDNELHNSMMEDDFNPLQWLPSWSKFGFHALFYGSFLYFWVLSYLRLKEVEV